MVCHIYFTLKIPKNLGKDGYYLCYDFNINAYYRAREDHFLLDN